MSRPLFVAGLGNPAPYLRTLHSAGNLLLDAVRTDLGLAPYSRHVVSTTATSPISLTLFHSPATMNVSGPAVTRAYKSWMRDLAPDARAQARLVVLHDELELAPGKLKLKRGGSARGHNGLRSIASSLASQDFVRIGVGIGRPASRQSDDVARYVLAKLPEDNLAKITAASPQVIAMLEMLAAEP